MNLKYNFSVHALRFAGQFPDICDILRPWRDNSTSKLQYTLFLKLGSHCNLSISIRFAFEIGVSLPRACCPPLCGIVQLTNFNTLCS
jgi:hypothetical protein